MDHSPRLSRSVSIRLERNSRRSRQVADSTTQSRTTSVPRPIACRRSSASRSDRHGGRLTIRPRVRKRLRSTHRPAACSLVGGGAAHRCTSSMEVATTWFVRPSGEPHAVHRRDSPAPAALAVPPKDDRRAHGWSPIHLASNSSVFVHLDGSTGWNE